MSEIDVDLPVGWCFSTIEEICELNPKHDSFLSESLPVSFVPMAAVSEVEGQIIAPEVRPLGEVKKGYTHFADGDVIFAKITPCMENGKAASVRGMVNGLACGTTEFFVFRSRGAIHQDYLFKFIRQESFRRAARATMQSGVGQARVPKEFVLETEIPLPPLPEQRRIVAKIEALQARSRKAREALEAIPPLLEQFRQSVLAAAFRGDLTADWREQHLDVEPASDLLERIRAERRRKWEQAELAKFKERQKLPPTRWDEKYQEPPKHLTARHLKSELEAIPSTWYVTNLETISELITGTTPSTSDEENWNGDIPFISPSDVHPRGHILTPKRTVTKLGASKARVIQSNTVLIVCIGTIGKVGFLDRTAVFNQQMNALVPCQFVIPRLLFYWCRHLKQWLAEEASATVNAAIINKTRLGLAPFVLPPLEEQILLAKLLDAAFYTADDIERRTSENLSEVSNLDQSILAKAFRGELVPQDPNDEPASVLLERIRAERANQEKVKPTRGRHKRSRKVVEE